MQTIKNEQRVGKILEKQGEILPNRKKSMLPLRIIPLMKEEDEKVIQRINILKSHKTFHNEVHKKYNNDYLHTMFTLLNKNEKNYHIKRNKLSLKTLNQWNDNENDCPNHSDLIDSNASVFQSPTALLTNTKQKLSHKEVNIRRLLLNNTECNESIYRSNNHHITQKCYQFQKPIHLVMRRKASKKAEMKERYFKGFSEDNMKLLELINKSDECMKNHQEQVKERMQRRFNGIGDYYNINTPRKMKDYQEKIFLKENNWINMTTIKTSTTIMNNKHLSWAKRTGNKTSKAIKIKLFN